MNTYCESVPNHFDICINCSNRENCVKHQNYYWTKCVKLGELSIDTKFRFMPSSADCIVLRHYQGFVVWRQRFSEKEWLEAPCVKVFIHK